MKAIAFAPGHISGFFAPKFDKDFLKTGSRGAGINISLGAKSEVIINNSKKRDIKIFINGKKSIFPIIQTALKYLIGERKINIDIRTTLDLPLGQGFGMSAASVVSSSYALSKIMNISYYDALKASHYSEIYHKTGLGDVISCTFGGIEIRNKPGIPPWGSIEHIIGNYELVICIIDYVIETKKILLDTNKIKLIKKYGNYCTDEIKESPTIENLFLLSNFFTEKTNLGTKKVLEAIRTANKFGKASMCMLGNSIFAIGQTNKLCEKLKKYGKIYVCKVDELGARIIN
jgi:pantoate kinase